MAPSNPYGDFDARSVDGRYRFEWTPFTPAVVAWRRAESFLRTARDHLTDAGTLEGFAIPGLEAQHHRYADGLEVLIANLTVEAAEAAVVASGLETANANYAAASEASRESYRQVMAVVDDVLATQGRRAVSPSVPAEAERGDQPWPTGKVHGVRWSRRSRSPARRATSRRNACRHRTTGTRR